MSKINQFCKSFIFLQTFNTTWNVLSELKAGVAIMSGSVNISSL